MLFGANLHVICLCVPVWMCFQQVTTMCVLFECVSEILCFWQIKMIRKIVTVTVCVQCNYVSHKYYLFDNYAFYVTIFLMLNLRVLPIARVESPLCCKLVHSPVIYILLLLSLYWGSILTSLYWGFVVIVTIVTANSLPGKDQVSFSLQPRFWQMSQKQNCQKTNRWIHQRSLTALILAQGYRGSHVL